jgi:hypothetical protein
LEDTRWIFTEDKTPEMGKWVVVKLPDGRCVDGKLQPYYNSVGITWVCTDGWHNVFETYWRESNLLNRI